MCYPYNDPKTDMHLKTSGRQVTWKVNYLPPSNHSYPGKGGQERALCFFLLIPLGLALPPYIQRSARGSMGTSLPPGGAPRTLASLILCTVHT